ncbi:MAG: YgfZ/GcvT domain-containing protein [Alphaproteobacteria bacterium]
MYYTHLPARGLISLTGDDTIPFLQGLITNDARKLEQGQPLYAALLSPQGKYLHDFFLIPQDGRIILDGEKHRLADLKQRLSLYKLRSKVAIEILPEGNGVVVCWGGGAQAENNQIFVDPRIISLGFRMVGDIAENMAWCEAQGFERAVGASYDKHRILHGIPDSSRDMTPDKSLMLEFNMDVLNAVDFSKGCYVGQEVTARTKYRAQIKKTLCVVEAQKGALPDAGATLIAAEKDIGHMLSSVGDTGLALMRIEALEQHETFTMECGTVIKTREVYARG